jgi:hypothetical protein
MAVRAPARYLLVSDNVTIRAIPSWLDSLRKKKVRKGISEIYLHLLSCWLRSRYRTPAGELASSSGKLELFELLSDQKLMLAHNNSILEIACHPAANTDGLEGSSIMEKRVLEYKFLRSEAFSRAVRKIELISFGALN